MDSNFTNENDPWEYSLDIDDSDLHLTLVMRSSSSARVEPSSSTPNPVRIIPGHAGTVQLSVSTCLEPSSSTPNSGRIIPGPAGLVQQAKQLKEKKVIEDVGEDDDFNSGAWISATNYVISTGGTVTGCLGNINNFLKKRKLDQVVAIVKSCSPNYLGDLNVTMKYLSGTVCGTIHYKVLDVGSYGNDITVGAAMILANVSVFTPKTSEHYLNITKKNVVKVFRTNIAKITRKRSKPDNMKRGFWSEVVAYFEKQIGENIRGHDAIITKWKNSMRLKIATFSVVYDSVQRMDGSGSYNLAMFQKALAKLKKQYGHAFTLEACWRILKNHAAWTEIEISLFNQQHNNNEV
ncbi:hypothetical protein Tco_0401853 [Tanacetum coccineum]